MKHLTISILLLTLAGVASAAGKLVYPWNAVTSIVQAGDSFEVWFDAEAGQVVESVELHGPFNTVEIPSESVTSKSGSWEYDPVSGNAYNMQIMVTVPENIPADRYDLVLHTNKGHLTSVSAVRVISEYKNNYKILHISDSHLGQRSNPKGLIEAKHTAIVNMANIIDPQIVLVTGDVVYWHPDPQVWQDRLDRFYIGDDSQGFKGMHDFNAATFVVAGNHDYKEGQEPWDCCHDSKSDFWNEYHGLQYHGFNYGNSRFTLINNGWAQYDFSWQFTHFKEWLDGDGAGGNFNVAAYHNPRVEWMEPFANEIDLNLAFVGHYHHQGDRNPHKLDDRFIMYYAFSVREYLEFNLLLVDDDQATHTALGYVNNDDTTDGYGLPTGSCRVLENDTEKNNPDSSVWVYNLTLDYEHDNDGGVSNNTATVVNKFHYAIPDARVRFVMPKGNVYSVTQGAIYQAFDGDQFHIVDVDIDLAANSTATIDIYH